jgi:hypothetical protein
VEIKYEELDELEDGVDEDIDGVRPFSATLPPLFSRPLLLLHLGSAI